MAAVIEVNVPEEPAALSVVLDRHGMAWQRYGRAGRPCWHVAGRTVPVLGEPAPQVKSWRHLVVDDGPLRLVHDAGEEA